jgi:maltooligosyltrehalose trehalohydrolase
VREFITANAGYWIDEFHMDGLRLDATQDIHDDSSEHVLVAIGRRVREAARGRRTVIVAENEPQHARLARPVAAGGYGLDALWNDDFHHSAMVALTGRREAYYSDYRGAPQEFVSAVKRGFLYQGQRYAWQQKARGTATDGLAPAALVAYLQNHDQIANSLRGLRAHALASPARNRALTALLLLAPWTPLLFQGQEFSASAPFLFFSDLSPELSGPVRSGRAEFLRQFKSLQSDRVLAHVPDPTSPETFDRCKLDLGERERHCEAYRLHCDLLRLRRTDPVFRAQRRGGVDGAVLGSTAFALRFTGEGGDERLLLVNLGGDETLSPAPEPLLAPPEGRAWALMWSSEAPEYGGGGTPAPDPDGAPHLPGESAVVMRPEPRP